ncbi:hypothetical protein ACNO5E_16375 [Vibrio parahaemolyticus]|uniref:hypothetical protein n=1 Tax=Vibrio parahaemolyticus TaxID=670 RepID=UPI000813994F|nr:hypothetical protein [Vibrio parahaemolyticus]OCP68395.1 hypothetical protein AKH08_16420 [Vibrio parahaemolyticus]
MKRNQLFLATVLLASPIFNYAHAIESGDELIENREISVNATTKVLYQLQSAVTAYYLERGGWPTTLSQITSGTEPFYSGSTSTALGTFSSRITGKAFLLRFTARNSNEDTLAMVQSVADLSASSYTSGVMEFVVPTPQTADIVNNMLSRTDDTSGRNAMLTDLLMGGNDLEDVKQFFAVDVELSGTATVNSVDADRMTSTEFKSLNATATDVSFDKALFNNFVVNSVISADSFTAHRIAVEDDSVGTSIDADSFSIDILNAANAYIDNAIGDTAEINNATFNIETTTSTLNVDQVLSASVAKVNTISAYKQTPIVFDSAVNFNGTTLNGSLNLSKNLYVSGSSSVDNLKVGSLEVKGTLRARSTDIDGSLITSGAGTITGGARIRQNLNAQDVFATAASFSSTVTADKGVEIQGQLNTLTTILQGNHKIANRDGLYIQGLSLSGKLLGKGATAYDADKVDGYHASQLARLDVANTFSGTQTIKGTANLYGNLYVGGRLVVDSQGYLYDGGKAIRNLYLSKDNAQSAYAAWNGSINNLKNRLNSKVTGLKNDHSSVGSLLATAESKAKSQKTKLSSIQSDINSLNSKRNTVNNNVELQSQTRSNQSTKLVSARNKLNSGPTYKTRSCTITTTRTETGVGTGVFTTKVINGCPSSYTTPSSVTTQYGKIN